MIYKQRKKGSPFYWSDDLYCDTKEKWLAGDPEAVFVDLDAKPQDKGTLSREFSNSINDESGGVIGGEREGFYTQKRDKCDKFVPEGVTSYDTRDSVTEKAPCDKRDTTTLATLALGWFKGVNGRFTTEQFDSEFGIKTPEEKANRRQIFHRAKMDGVIRRDKLLNNVWYKVDEELEDLDPFGIGQLKPLPLKWAFQIEDYVDLYAGDLIVIAGAKNAGKTAFLLDFLYRNKDNVECWYFSSELGSERLKVRLDKFECDLDGWKKVNFKRRKACSYWADIMRPNAYNIVDFMEIYEKFYEIASPLADIHSTLNKGIALVAIQKNKGADMGHGGSFSTEKASLYLSIDNGSIKIVYAKSWHKENVSPDGMTATFKLVKGCDFRPILPLGHHKVDKDGNLLP